MAERGLVPRGNYLLSHQFFASFKLLNQGGVVYGSIDCQSKNYTVDSHSPRFERPVVQGTDTSQVNHRLRK